MARRCLNKDGVPAHDVLGARIEEVIAIVFGVVRD